MRSLTIGRIVTALLITVQPLPTAVEARGATSSIPSSAVTLHPLLRPPTRAGGALLTGEMLALFQSAGSQNQCWAYSYDRNGNRTARSNLTYNTTGTWGSMTYGCSNWSSP
jgi:hypothetical protein